MSFNVTLETVLGPWNNIEKIMIFSTITKPPKLCMLKACNNPYLLISSRRWWAVMMRQRYGNIRKEQGREYRTKRGQTHKESTREEHAYLCLSQNVFILKWLCEGILSFEVPTFWALTSQVRCVLGLQQKRALICL